MNKFKIGDKVTVKENFWEIESRVFINNEMKKLAGRTLEVKSIDSDGDVRTKQDDSKDETEWSWDENLLEFYIEPSKEITWETLKWKDVVVDKVGDERMVLRVENDLVDVSGYGNFDAHGTTLHKKELQKFGYTIKQATPVEKPKETIEVGEHTYKLVK